MAAISIGPGASGPSLHLVGGLALFKWRLGLVAQVLAHVGDREGLAAGQRAHPVRGRLIAEAGEELGGVERRFDREDREAAAPGLGLGCLDQPGAEAYAR